MKKSHRFSPFLAAGVFLLGTLAPQAAQPADVLFGPPALAVSAATRLYVTADMDGDGDGDILDMEVISVFHVVAWHENPGGFKDGTGWTKHDITNALDNSERPDSLFATDIDGDGDMDVVWASSQPFRSSIEWFENTAGNGTVWTVHTISSGGPPDSEWIDGMSPGDMDGDGDIDLVRSIFGQIDWYENTGNGAAWTLRTGPANHGVTWLITAADIDGDGDMDVVSIGEHSVSDHWLGWYENADGSGTVWQQHVIDESGWGGGLVADLDGDGDLDMFSNSVSGPFWYENVTDSSRTGWPRHEVDTLNTVSFLIFPADMDGDGDIDGVSATRLGDELSHSYAIIWYDNTAGNGLTWTRRIVRTFHADFPSEMVQAVDIDGDRDMDVTEIRVSPRQILWHRNDGSADLVFRNGFE